MNHEKPYIDAEDKRLTELYHKIAEEQSEAKKLEEKEVTPDTPIKS